MRGTILGTRVTVVIFKHTPPALVDFTAQYESPIFKKIIIRKGRIISYDKCKAGKRQVSISHKTEEYRSNWVSQRKSVRKVRPK